MLNSNRHWRIVSPLIGGGQTSGAVMWGLCNWRGLHFPLEIISLCECFYLRFGATKVCNCEVNSPLKVLLPSLQIIP